MPPAIWESARDSVLRRQPPHKANPCGASSCGECLPAPLWPPSCGWLGAPRSVIRPCVKSPPARRQQAQQESGARATMYNPTGPYGRILLCCSAPLRKRPAGFVRILQRRVGGHPPLEGRGRAVSKAHLTAPAPPVPARPHSILRRYAATAAPSLAHDKGRPSGAARIVRVPRSNCPGLMLALFYAARCRQTHEIR